MDYYIYYPMLPPFSDKWLARHHLPKFNTQTYCRLRYVFGDIDMTREHDEQFAKDWKIHWKAVGKTVYYKQWRQGTNGSMYYHSIN